MTQLIKNWEELSQIPPNDKYKIIVDKDMSSSWIVPICDEKGDKEDFICNCRKFTIKEYYERHIYLSTHTFYKSQYKHSTEILQKCGFDIELENWDKE